MWPLAAKEITSKTFALTSPHKFEFNKGFNKFLSQASNLYLQWYFVQFTFFQVGLHMHTIHIWKNILLQFVYWGDPRQHKQHVKQLSSQNKKQAGPGPLATNKKW